MSRWQTRNVSATKIMSSLSSLAFLESRNLNKQSFCSELFQNIADDWFNMRQVDLQTQDQDTQDTVTFSAFNLKNKMLISSVFLLSVLKLLIVSCESGVFPLRMPNLNPTKNEAYLCTGVEIGSERRFSLVLIKLIQSFSSQLLVDRILPCPCSWQCSSHDSRWLQQKTSQDQAQCVELWQQW